jgi:hypothetical protein
MLNNPTTNGRRDLKFDGTLPSFEIGFGSVPMSKFISLPNQSSISLPGNSTRAMNPSLEPRQFLVPTEKMEGLLRENERLSKTIRNLEAEIRVLSKRVDAYQAQQSWQSFDTAHKPCSCDTMSRTIRTASTALNLPLSPHPHHLKVLPDFRSLKSSDDGKISALYSHVNMDGSNKRLRVDTASCNKRLTSLTHQELEGPGKEHAIERIVKECWQTAQETRRDVSKGPGTKTRSKVAPTQQAMKRARFVLTDTESKDLLAPTPKKSRSQTPFPSVLTTAFYGMDGFNSLWEKYSRAIASTSVSEEDAARV